MSKLDQIVFVVLDGQIVEGPIHFFDGYIEETTTPKGVAPRYHVRENELWSWGVGGNNPQMVREFDTEDEAQVALEDGFAHDFWNSTDLVAFKTKASAEAYLDNEKKGE